MGQTRDKLLSAILYVPIRVLWALLPSPNVPRRLCSLIEAVKHGDVLEVQSLLAQGADPNLRDTQIVYRRMFRTLVAEVPAEMAKTALILAAEAGHKEIVIALLDAGAEVEAKTSIGCSALQAASGREGDADIVELLLDRGADIEACGFDTPLIAAAVGQRADLVRLLLDRGANVNATDSEGFTALIEPAGLMEPSDFDYTEIVEMLIAAGIDVNARNNEGLTALHFAKEQNNHKMVDLLLRRGSDGS